MAFTFDESFYLQSNPDVLLAVLQGRFTSAYDHFVKFGAKELRTPNSTFDAVYYATTNTDVVAAVTSGKVASVWDHYVNFGINESRAPSAALADFSEAGYRLANTDVDAAIKAGTIKSALSHYLNFGAKEGRPPCDANGNPIGDYASGKAFTLTEAADNIKGTAGDDRIGGTNSAASVQFSAADMIDGGKGKDELVLSLNANYGGGAVIKNVEVLTLTGDNNDSGGGATAFTFDANGIEGLTQIKRIAGDAEGVTFNNVGKPVSLHISNATSATTITYTEAAVSAEEKAYVELNNVGVVGGAVAAVNINSATANAVGVEKIEVAAYGLASNVQLNSNDTSVKEVLVSGTADLTLVLNTNVQTTATKIDASALKGKLTLSGFGTADHTVIGGSGDDSVDFGATFTAADSYDGGAGVNTLGITTSGTQTSLTAAQWAKVKNVQTLSVTEAGGNDFNQDASLVKEITTFRFNGSGTGSEDFTVTKLANNTNINVRGAVENVALSLADVSGLSDTVNLSLGSSTSATAATIGVGSGDLVDIAGLETLNISAVAGTVGGATHVITDDLVTAKHVITGNANLTISSAAAAQIDATGLKGALTIGNGTAYAVTNGNIQSGSGNDTITAGANAQVINGGEGTDRITGGADADILKGGAGADTFVYGGGNSMANALAASANGVDQITDFVAGTDKIALINTAASGVSSIVVAATQINVASAADLAAIVAAVGTSVAASDNTTATAPVYSAAIINVAAGAAAGTYLMVNDANNAASATLDLFVNITGITGTLSASDFVFA